FDFCYFASSYGTNEASAGKLDVGACGRYQLASVGNDIHRGASRRAVGHGDEHAAFSQHRHRLANGVRTRASSSILDGLSAQGDADNLFVGCASRGNNCLSVCGAKGNGNTKANLTTLCMRACCPPGEVSIQRAVVTKRGVLFKSVLCNRHYLASCEAA